MAEMQRIVMAFGERRRTKVLVAPPWAQVGDTVRIPIAFVPATYDPNCAPADGPGRGQLIEEWRVVEAEMTTGDVIVMQRPGHA